MLLLAALGCSRATGAASENASSAPGKAFPFAASSLAGKYLLKGALSGKVEIRADSVIVEATSAVLANRLPTSPPHSPLFRNLAIQAFVAVPDRQSWKVAAQSAQMPVAPMGMHADTTISVAPLRFAIPRPRIPIAGAWLAFQLSAYDLPGSPLYREGKAGLKTYVCSGQFLAAAPGDSTLVARLVSDSPLTC